MDLDESIEHSSKWQLVRKSLGKYVPQLSMDLLSCEFLFNCKFFHSYKTNKKLKIVFKAFSMFRVLPFSELSSALHCAEPISCSSQPARTSQRESKEKIAFL